MGALTLPGSELNTNSVQYNTGWNFRFQNHTLVTGPFVGVDYLYGSVRGYNETGGGMAALSYERQNLQNNGTSVSLINAPFTAAGGNQSPG